MYVLGLTASDGAGTSPVERLEVRVAGAYEVPADYADLASAVYAATDGATIRVAAGTWPCAVDLDGVDLTIEGAGSGLTTLDAGGWARVIRAARGESVTVRGATLTNGVDGRGGAIYVEGGSADLDDVAMIGNAAAEGGALFVTESGSIDGIGVVGVDNVGGFRAGFLQSYQTSTVSFAQSVFAQNRAPDDQGGVFRIYESLLDLVNVVLHDNFAEEGGGLYAYGSSTVVTLDHVTATHNDGTVYGSVIRLSTGADVTVVDSLFARNEGQSVAADTSTAGTYTQTWTLVDENTSTTTFYLSHSPDPVDGVDGNLVDNEYAADFASVTDDGDWTNDDWSLLPTSDAVDAGDPAGGLDPDGSAPDLGATGGPGGFVP
jgi:hypothetical protein